MSDLHQIIRTLKSERKTFNSTKLKSNLFMPFINERNKLNKLILENVKLNQFSIINIFKCYKERTKQNFKSF